MYYSKAASCMVFPFELAALISIDLGTRIDYLPCRSIYKFLIRNHKLPSTTSCWLVPCLRSLSSAANFPSDPTHQWRSLYWEPGDASHLEPTHCLVPLQSPSLQDFSQPAAPWSGGGPGSWVPPGGTVREGWPIEEHWDCRTSRVSGCRRASCDLEHLLDHVRDCLVQRRRAIDCPFTDSDREEEGAWPATDCRWMGKVHRWVLLWWDLWSHLGLLPSLCPQPPLLRQVENVESLFGAFWLSSSKAFVPRAVPNKCVCANS